MHPITLSNMLYCRWFPECSFLLQQKGEDYVTEVHNRTPANKKVTSIVMWLSSQSLSCYFPPPVFTITHLIQVPPPCSLSLFNSFHVTTKCGFLVFMMKQWPKWVACCSKAVINTTLIALCYTVKCIIVLYNLAIGKVDKVLLGRSAW